MPRVVARLTVPLLLLAACSGDTSATTTTAASESSTTTTRATSATISDARRRALAEAVSAYGAPGGIGVVLDEDGRWIEAVGDADTEATPSGVTMRFRAAEITTTIVAAVALDFVEEGVLDLDQTVGSLLPGLLVDGSITLRQVLDHTSGLFDLAYDASALDDIGAIVDPGRRARGERLVIAYQQFRDDAEIAPDMIVAMADTHPRSFAAGTGFQRSAPDYEIVGLVIEAVSGVPLAKAVSDRIAAPVGLDSFALDPAERISPEFPGSEYPAVGDEPIEFEEDFLTFGAGANDGLVTNADDLARFLRALLRGQVIDEPLLTDMVTPTAVSIAAGTPFGLGIGRFELSCGTFYGNQGSGAGTVSIALADTGGARVVVIVMNARRPSDPDLVGLAERLVCGE